MSTSPGLPRGQSSGSSAAFRLWILLGWKSRIQRKSRSSLATAPRVPGVLGRFCLAGHLSQKQPRGCFAGLCSSRGPQTVLGLWGAWFVTALWFGSHLCTAASQQLRAGPCCGFGVRLHPDTPGGEQGRVGGQRALRGRILGREQDVVPGTPGTAAGSDSGRRLDGAGRNPGDAFSARSNRWLPG